MSVSDWERIERSKQAFIDGTAMADIWTASDVIDVKEDLTLKEAKNVLAHIKEDAVDGDGISWSTIEAAIFLYHGDKDNDNE